MTTALLSSIAVAGYGVAAFSYADPAPEAQDSCAAIDRAAHDSAVNMDKIHGIAQTISPALPHPDHPEQETGNVNIIDLFFKARDLSRSLRQSSNELRAAEAGVDLPELRDAADNLAQVNDDTATSFDNASNPLGSRPPMNEMANQMFDTVKGAIQAFQNFNSVYSNHCGEDLMPNYEDQPSADEPAPPADEPAPPAEEAAPAGGN
ncbi:hypothetical protein [Segniliparus rotundus]|uniref:hypothetical protein n=1 Tax=Segniliparus rotundus TaxID=286802 RepID=UPI0002DD95E0|nr:hypothetical protein [Segniliparus rotundus]